MGLTKEPKLIGIEIGGTKLQLVVGDTTCTIEQRLRYTINPETGAAGIQAQLTDVLTNLIAQHAVAGIGVGFGGPVNWQTGDIQVSHQIEGWAHFNLKTWLQELTGKPVYIDNDANIAALGEAVHGGGKSYNLVFYMTIGSGIGGGLAVNKNIYHGKSPGEIEIGHIRLSKNGDTLESKCSGWAVNKKIKIYIQQHPHSLLAKLAMENSGPEASLLSAALEREDKVAREIIDEVSDDIAFALSHVVHLLHPEVLIIGGGLSLLKEYLRLPVINKLPYYIMKAFLPPPAVQTATLAEDAVPIGAMELARKALYLK